MNLTAKAAALRLGSVRGKRDWGLGIREKDRQRAAGLVSAVFGSRLEAVTSMHDHDRSCELRAGAFGSCPYVDLYLLA